MFETTEVKVNGGRPKGALNRATLSYNVIRRLAELKFDPLKQMVKIAKAEGKFADVDIATRAKATADILDRVCPKMKHVEIKDDKESGARMDQFRDEMKKLLTSNEKDY